MRYQQTNEQRQQVNTILAQGDRLARLVSYLEAEGSIFLILRSTKERRFGYRLNLSLNIANASESTIRGFGTFTAGACGTNCGTIRSTRRPNFTIFYWEVASQEQITSILIPVFQATNFQTEKLQHDFPLFVECSRLLNESTSFDIALLLKIIKIRNQFLARTVVNINDVEDFNKILTLLVEKNNAQPATDLAENIELLRKAIQFLNQNNSKIWSGFA